MRRRAGRRTGWTHLFTGPGAASSERAAEQETTVFTDLEVVAARRSATLRLALTVLSPSEGTDAGGDGGQAGSSPFISRKKRSGEIVPKTESSRRSSARGDRDDGAYRRRARAMRGSW